MAKVVPSVASFRAETGQSPFYRRWPKWIWAVIAFLACLQPAAHLLSRYAPPEGMVPTGLHIPDSAIFIQSMDMFSSKFYSAYAPCASQFGQSGTVFFPMPHQWFYGLQGIAAKAVGASYFLFYGFFNGLMTAVYLCVVYGFFRTVAPRSANLAFALYALGGGLGGLLYVLSSIVGFTGDEAFEQYFLRFALYELLEGEHLFPATFYGRSYYLASLACCIGGLALFIRLEEGHGRRGGWAAGLLLMLGTFINLRFGTFTAGIFVLYLLCRHGQAKKGLTQAKRGTSEDVSVPFLAQLPTRNAAIFLLPGIAGWIAGWLLMGRNPAVIQNHVDVGGMNLWFSPLLSCVALFLLVTPLEVWVRSQKMATVPRGLAFAAIGYVLTFTILFVAYQAYYGNLLIARDAAVAVRISDWSLLGAALGIVWSRLRTARAGEGDAQDWIVLWLLAFLVMGISAWGQGWFLRFGPQRLILMLHLPISLLTAAALQRMAVPRPRLSYGITAAIVACGIASILVSTFMFQSPLGRRAEAHAFAWTHTEAMTEHDAALLARIEPGARVLALSPASDVIVARGDNPVVFGIGSFNMSDARFVDLEHDVAFFFSTEADDSYRRARVEQWCADYVFCSDTWFSDLNVVDELRRSSWLVEVAGDNNAALFRVTRNNE